MSCQTHVTFSDLFCGDGGPKPSPYHSRHNPGGSSPTKYGNDKPFQVAIFLYRRCGRSIGTSVLSKLGFSVGEFGQHLKPSRTLGRMGIRLKRDGLQSLREIYVFWFCIRARLQSGRKGREKMRALAPAVRLWF
jgi:hypothetical protein